MSDSTFDKGMTTRREVLGSAHVERVQANQTALDSDFQRLITEYAWGSVWSRPELDRRTRSLVTIAILASLGRTEELALHLRASRNTGVEQTEIAEILHHVAIYAGVPAANTAFAIAKRELGASPSESEHDPTDQARRNP